MVYYSKNIQKYPKISKNIKKYFIWIKLSVDTFYLYIKIYDVYKNILM
jgi:hypothetical protein